MRFDTDMDRKVSASVSDVIAAHIEEDVTDEEMDEILNFIDYIKSKRE